MIIIVCVDDDMGIMFNNRRQSQDKVLRNRLINKLCNKRIFMSEYSAKQFEPIYSEKILVCNDFIKRACREDYCFIEDTDILKDMDKVDRIILYRWNRKYPSDIKLGIDLSSNWILTSSEDFVGNSHEKISEQIYTRKILS